MGILLQCNHSLPDTLATSKILNTKDQGLLSGLEGNWQRLHLCVINSSDKPMTNSLLRGARGLLIPGPWPGGFAGHPGQS